MNAAIFASKLEAELWKDELSNKLLMDCKIFNKIRDGLYTLQNEKFGIIIVQSRIASGFDKEGIKKLALKENCSAGEGIYLLELMKNNFFKKNNDCPIIYTAMGDDRKTSKTKEIFGKYPNTYFFNELSTDGISSIVSTIINRK